LQKSLWLRKSNTWIEADYLVKKVLVAVDGSENSYRALDFSLEFTEKFGAELTIMNVSESSGVVSVPPEIAPYTNDNMVVVARDLRKFHEEVLNKATIRAKKIKPNVSISAILKEGNPASAIIEAANDGNFDVVVLGHRGIGKFKGIFVGSISEKVARSLSCTVILVR